MNITCIYGSYQLGPKRNWFAHELISKEEGLMKIFHAYVNISKLNSKSVLDYINKQESQIWNMIKKNPMKK